MFIDKKIISALLVFIVASVLMTILSFTSYGIGLAILIGLISGSLYYIIDSSLQMLLSKTNEETES